jgi:choline dehydrogenase-like flavoprotein
VLADFHELESGSVLVADLCIVGAGAAGITLAREFLGTGVDVLLLESGGRDFDAAAQDLNAGRNAGMTYYDLVDARLRFFGGTTAIWGGRCAPLDPIDFERREWVPHSGWPFDRAHLDPWYRRAHDMLGLGGFEYDARVWQCVRLEPPAFDPARIATDFWRFDMQRDRFTLDRCADLIRTANVRILLHATCTGLVPTPDANGIAHATISAPGGRCATVKARRYVLACGGIENPRLLLASNQVEKAGIGNGRDLVGRFFMEHPHGRAGRVVAADPYALWRLFRRTRADHGVPVALTWRPGDAAQRERGTLNASLTIKLQRNPEAGLTLNKRLFHLGAAAIDPHRAGRSLLYAYKFLRDAVAGMLRPPIEWVRVRAGLRHLFLVVRAEQAPNPDSRVLLTRERDALGMPRVALDWRLTGADKAAVAGNVAILDGELRRLGLGHVEPASWLEDGTAEWPVDPTVSIHHIGGFHHMGTTRMGTDPATSVVDEHGRVHGYHNLFVAGSSVFPTGGWANPTLTILALALRLGHHLRRTPD